MGDLIGLDGKQRQSPKRLSKTRRRHLILELYESGASVDQIAEQVGIMPRQVNAIIGQAIERMNQLDGRTVEQLRQVELHRLDQVMLRIWPRVRDGDLKAIDRYLQIVDRRSKIAGLNAPQKIEHSGHIEHELIPAEEVARMEAAWAEVHQDVIEGEAVELEPATGT